jgi:hypothetical protein
VFVIPTLRRLRQEDPGGISGQTGLYSEILSQNNNNKTHKYEFA